MTSRMAEILSVQFMPAGTNTPPTIAATPVSALPPPIGVNGYGSVPAPTNGQQGTETLYTNGVHTYQGMWWMWKYSRQQIVFFHIGSDIKRIHLCSRCTFLFCELLGLVSTLYACKFVWHQPPFHLCQISSLFFFLLHFSEARNHK